MWVGWPAATTRGSTQGGGTAVPAQEQAGDPRRATAGDDVVIDLTDATVDRVGGARLDAAGVEVALRPAPRVAVSWRQRLTSPLGLLLVVNVLNVVDAVLTVLWIELGIAREANPIVDAIGFPAKIVGVAILSAAAAVLRPRALLVPIVALALVVVYPVVGAGVVLLTAGG